MTSLSPPTSPIVSTHTSHFVQALHDYLPSSAPITDEPVTCLFFKKGSIIEVFNRDDSGWWDGQCGDIRGWFPSNYVGRIGEAKRSSIDFEPENDELIHWQQEQLKKQKEQQLEQQQQQQQQQEHRLSFMEEVTEITKKVIKEYNSNIQESVHIPHLVSCIRSILIEFNIYNKDSPLLKVYPEMAKQRIHVFCILNKLALAYKQHDQDIEEIIDILLTELNQFEKLLVNTSSVLDGSASSRCSSIASSTFSTNLYSDYYSNSTSSVKLNVDQVLQSVLEHQNVVKELLSNLLAQLPQFLEKRHQDKAMELLEVTRKVVEAVKGYLSVIEYVCSSLDDFIDKGLSIIPEDPQLVSLVFAKESVYSAITNLVTAIRAASSHMGKEEDYALELDHLNHCCEQVIKTINHCADNLRTCLLSSSSSSSTSTIEQPTPNEEEVMISSKSFHNNLEMMNRKISSLKAIQQQLSASEQEETIVLKPSISDHLRRPRGLSLTSLRSSLHKSRSIASYESLPDVAKTPKEDAIFNQDGYLTGATLEALVQLLTLHEKSPELAIWTSRVLIPVRLRVYNVIKTWLESYFDYSRDAAVQKELLEFTERDMSQVMPSPAKRMANIIHKASPSKQQQQQQSQQPPSSSSSHNSSIFSNLSLFDDHNVYPPSIISKSTRNTLKRALMSPEPLLSAIHLQDIDPVELARQITLLENALFCQIRPYEIIGQEFKKKHGESKAVHVKAMIQKSTQITSWISGSILNENDVKKRAQLIKYWIKVGDACLHMNNYNTLMAIRSALDSTCIIRLKKTWEYVSSKYRSIWEPIYKATDSQRNFAEYRSRLKTAVAPCLPFLGVYLTDVTFIDDGNADYRMSPGGKRLVNFDKYIKTTKVLNEIDQFQIHYRFIEVDEIQHYIKRILESVEQDDQVFYAKSLKLEPKEENDTNS
ncbi:ras GEF [Rhizopus microsporus]|uniref:Ras GEF n=1 Tax=Rhizopus microsporus TaxID=58291 RepID=A0A1X0S1F1_RHIZD|nr:ras GEF [Rhizopus microsporus]